MYRYVLYRSWSDDPAITWIMLNPSTADEKKDDATIRRCVQLSKKWGYGSLTVVNLFAYRATRPRDLWKAADPVGPDNDFILQSAASLKTKLVVAWGNYGAYRGRDIYVLQMIRGVNLYCIGKTDRGCPKHPLFVPSNSELTSFLPSTNSFNEDHLRAQRSRLL